MCLTTDKCWCMCMDSFIQYTFMNCLTVVNTWERSIHKAHILMRETSRKWKCNYQTEICVMEEGQQVQQTRTPASAVQSSERGTTDELTFEQRRKKFCMLTENVLIKFSFTTPKVWYYFNSSRWLSLIAKVGNHLLKSRWIGIANMPYERLYIIPSCRPFFLSF